MKMENRVREEFFLNISNNCSLTRFLLNLFPL